MNNKSERWLKTCAEFRSLFGNNTGPEAWKQLPHMKKKTRGSNWNQAHLQFCRVILTPCLTKFYQLAGLTPSLEDVAIILESPCTRGEGNCRELLNAHTRDDLRKKLPADIWKDGGDFGSFYVKLSLLLAPTAERHFSSLDEREDGLELPDTQRPVLSEDDEKGEEYHRGDPLKEEEEESHHNIASDEEEDASKYDATPPQDVEPEQEANVQSSKSRERLRQSQLDGANDSDSDVDINLPLDADDLSPDLTTETSSQELPKKRRRIQVSRPDCYLIPSTVLGSSPNRPQERPPQSSQEPYTPSDSSFNEEHNDERLKRELVANGIALEFLSVLGHVYLRGHPQPENGPILAVNMGPTRRRIANGTLDCEIEDDGSLGWMKQEGSGGAWQWVGSSHCVLECKPRVENLIYKSEQLEPGIDVKLLGQQVAELLGALLSELDMKRPLESFDALPSKRSVGPACHYPADREYSFFLVSLQQTTFCLLHVEFTREYIKYFLQLDSEGSRKNQAESLPDSKFFIIHRSKYFQLEEPNGRLEAAKMILAMALLLKNSGGQPVDESARGGEWTERRERHR